VPPAVPPVAGGFSPLDEELGLLPQVNLTPTLAESVVRLGSWVPFGVAGRMLEHFVHTQVSEATITRLTERAGAAYEAVQEAQAACLHTAARPAAVQGPPLQQVSVDGAFVPLVHKQWTEAKTVAIGTVQPVERQADGTVEIHTVDLSYFSRVAECHAFTAQATIETVRRGTLTAGKVVGVADGAVWEETFFAVQRHDAVRILDWCHAVGSLAKCAQALYGVDTKENHAWLAMQRETLVHGDPQVVLAKLRGLREELTVQAGDGPPPPALTTLTESLDYLAKRAAMLRYAEFRAAGYPIGSGIVESANKLVVHARLKGAGMHWALAHVNPLLALRGMACSDRWEEAWPQLVHQWRVQARTTVLVHRARRRAARQVALDQAARQTSLAPGTVEPLMLVGTTLATVPQDTPPTLALPHPDPAGAQPATAVRPHLGRAPSCRPAPTHPWRAPLLHPHSPTLPDPGM
jgi:hypothetical protein